MKHLLFGGLMAVLTLSACGPSGREISLSPAEACRDKLCEGDVVPTYDYGTHTALKLNGIWFVGPREYFSAGNNGAIFFWPSKTPMTGRGPGIRFPEQGQPFSEVGIEILLRSDHIPPEPRGYKLIELAEKNDWILRRETLRRGLEVIQMKHVRGPDGYFIDYTSYYVATELRGPDGLPPVGGCNSAPNIGNGGGGFIWKDGIWAGIRMSPKHCRDWPEIFQEVVRVLSLLTQV